MISKLDLAWEAINALGGYVAPDDLAGRSFSKAIDKARRAGSALLQARSIVLRLHLRELKP